MAREAGGAARRRAECTCLSPASYFASFPWCSAHCFGVALHARGCCGFGLAARHCAALPVVVVLDGPVGAAQQQLRDGCGLAIVRGKVQRRVPARPTAAGTRPGALNGRFAASANGAPVAVPGVHVGVGIDEQSDDSAIAVARRPMQRGVASRPVDGRAKV
jgi:hypothetical protein